MELATIAILYSPNFCAEDFHFLYLVSIYITDEI